MQIAFRDIESKEDFDFVVSLMKKESENGHFLKAVKGGDEIVVYRSSVGYFLKKIDLAVKSSIKIIEMPENTRVGFFILTGSHTSKVDPLHDFDVDTDEMRKWGDDIELLSLAISQRFKKRGIGKVAIKKIVALCRDLGAKTFSARTKKKSTVMTKILLSQGFEFVDETSGGTKRFLLSVHGVN